MVQLSPSCERCVYTHASSSTRGWNHSGDTQDGRGEERINHDLPQNDRFTKRESLPLPAVSSFFYEVAAAIESFIFLSRVRFCSRRSAASAASLRQKLQDERGGRGKTVVDQRSKSSRPGFLSRPAFAHRSRQRLSGGRKLRQQK